MPNASSSPRPESPSRRRQLLAAGLGGAGLAALSRAVQAAEPTNPAAAPATPLTAGTPAAGHLLTQTAQTTEGPFYFDPGKVRQDITEGQPGVPLEVRFTVVDPHGKPLAGKRVDLWHCNATGVYSGYAGQSDERGHAVSTRGQTFLRGSQPVGADGVAMFRTIYPGWYAGRATHLHIKVLDGNRAMLTTQCFLPDALSEYLYTQLAGYKRSRLRETLNSNDGIALMAGETTLGAVREAKDRYVATLTLVVGTAAAAPREPAPGPMSDGGSPPPPPPGRGAHDAPSAGSARAAAIVPGTRL
ncbi:Protocatechuate 3,4-dioxygenase beta subunit [Cupriavidus sp. YR651]|uniref:intradiol ring-cleavage dioxygenase n=1 Tax=Cupriavidus sp. YR651 TaxID=1855315 RepID=UPI0008855C2B|nr:intradiol ring-cleavage dioxygenase [Cupriavidus sp. YR651]SDC63129.1 Protocatechuate 3,4-dioxygenase beta subunit [Cupriavidus sp. YR651]